MVIEAPVAIPGWRKAGSLPSVSIVGCGGFGELVLEMLAPHCIVKGFDSDRDRGTGSYPRAVNWASAALADIVVLAVPVQELENALTSLRPHMRPRTLVIDVCSVKEKPVAQMLELVPDNCDILGSHPLFGPQSARFGLRGARIALTPVRGKQHRRVAAFLRHVLKLQVIKTTAEQHDREMAYVQGLTHMVARIVGRMAMPGIALKTRPFNLMEDICSLVGSDTDKLFAAIMAHNRFAPDVLQQFIKAFGEQVTALDSLDIDIRQLAGGRFRA